MLTTATRMLVMLLHTNYWMYFLDLSMADPTYILPLITTSTIYLQLYLGADGLNTSTMPDLMKKVKYSRIKKIPELYTILLIFVICILVYLFYPW